MGGLDPPDFARLMPGLRLAPPAKPAWPKIVSVPAGRGLSAIVRRQSNVGGPPVYLQLHSFFARLTPDFDRPSGTGLSASLPRHFVPGYDHLVPPGTKVRAKQPPVGSVRTGRR